MCFQPECKCSDICVSFPEILLFSRFRSMTYFYSDSQINQIVFFIVAWWITKSTVANASAPLFFFLIKISRWGLPLLYILLKENARHLRMLNFFSKPLQVTRAQHSDSQSKLAVIALGPNNLSLTIAVHLSKSGCCFPHLFSISWSQNFIHQK